MRGPCAFRRTLPPASLVFWVSGPLEAAAALCGGSPNMPRGHLCHPHLPPPLLQLLGSFYSHILQQAASWGLASLYYDIQGAATVTAEAALAPALAAWVEQQSSANDSSQLYGLIDGRIVVGGHSRGGKLAALIYAGGCARVRLCLLGPVVAQLQQILLPPPLHRLLSE